MTTTAPPTPPETAHKPAPGPLRAPPAVKQEELESSGRAVMPIASILAHKRLAITIALLVALLGLPIAYIKGTPSYMSTAVIHVSPRFVRTLATDQELELQSNTQYRDFVEQQVRTVNRFDVCMDALERLGERRKLWDLPDESPRRAAERLQGSLSARAVHDTYMFTVSLAGREAEGLDEIINAVVDAYLDVAKREEIFGADQRVEDLVKHRETLLEEVRSLSDQRSEIAQELGVTTFNENMLNPYDELLIRGKEALDTARRVRFEVEARLRAHDPSQGEKSSAALDALAWQKVDGDAGIASLKSNANFRRAQVLAEIAGLSEDHVGRRAGEREMRLLDEEIRALEQRLLARFRDEIFAGFRAEALAAREVEANVQADLIAQEERAQWFARRYNEALSLSGEIVRARSLLDKMGDRIDFLEIETGAPGWLRLVERARRPEIPISGGRKKLAILFAFGGIFLGLGVAVGVDFLDRRVRVPNQLTPLLGFPPLGWVLEGESESTRSFIRDQVRRIASALERDRRASGTRAVLMTGVKPGGGVTTLALEIGRELQELGIPAVVLEADALAPDPRYGGREGAGVAQLLRVAGTPLESVVVRGDASLPDRVPLGALGGGRHLPSVTELPRVLEQLYGCYEIVLIDGPPILLSADAELLAGLVDAALLIVEADANVVGEVRRAAKTLSKAGPPAAGALLNRVRPIKGGGYVATLLDEYQHARKAKVPIWATPWLWR